MHDTSNTGIAVCAPALSDFATTGEGASPEGAAVAMKLFQAATVSLGHV